MHFVCQTECKIYLGGIEAAFIKYPVLEPSFLYSGYPGKDLRHKFLMAQESDVTGAENMRYYQCGEYPIEFVLSENIDKHFASHNHVGHYVISVVMQGTVTVCLENKEAVCCRGDVG